MAGLAEDGHSAGGDQDEYWGVGVGASDAEVVQAAGVVQGEFAELVDGVMADAEVCLWLAGGAGFGACLVGLFGGDGAGVGAVGSLGVLDGAEGVEQGLQFVRGGG
ncbi:hypothetical protein TM48_00010 [Mycobacterium shottsii]|nr:hypothetical protein TM48_00010 [Mycobacterium shottsii]